VCSSDLGESLSVSSRAESAAAHGFDTLSGASGRGESLSVSARAESAAAHGFDTLSAKGGHGESFAVTSLDTLPGSQTAEALALRGDSASGLSRSRSGTAAQRPVVRLTKSADCSTTWIGRVVTFYVKVENQGNLAIEKVHIVDTLIPGCRYLDSETKLEVTRTPDSSTVLTCNPEQKVAPGRSIVLSFRAVLTSLEGTTRVPTTRE
jgi:uncharacterized repeat protein (TIGR01451 family)